MAASLTPALPMPSDNESLEEIESQALSDLGAVADGDALERWRAAGAEVSDSRVRIPRELAMLFKAEEAEAVEVTLQLYRLRIWKCRFGTGRAGRLWLAEQCEPAGVRTDGPSPPRRRSCATPP